MLDMRMAKAVHRSWFKVALGNGQVVAASGEHLGQAVAAAEQHAKSHAIAVARTEDAPLGESLGKQTIVATTDTVTPSSFALPPGVLPALGHEGQAIARGWIERDVSGARSAPEGGRGSIERPQDKHFVIEAQTDAAHVIDAYLGLVERVPAADNLEVKLLPHFEDTGATDVYLTSRVNAQKILRFLDDYDEELFGNGHIEVSVYVRSHKATLRLTEHKTVAWIADDRALAGDVTRWLKELDVPRVEVLPTVAGVPHFHYRGAKSRGRKALADELYRQRLRRVGTVRPATGPRDTAG